MTMILEGRLVFLHAKKTAGTWAHLAMLTACPHTDDRRRTLRHVGLDRGRVLAKSLGPNTKIFAFVRHPVTWLESYWAYRNDTGWRAERFDQDCKANRFPKFIANYLKKHPGAAGKMQERWVGTADGDQVDYVGRFENLENDLVAILRAERIKFDEALLRGVPPQKLATPRSKRLAKATPEMRVAICRSEAAFIGRFYSGGPVDAVGCVT